MPYYVMFLKIGNYYRAPLGWMNQNKCNNLPAWIDDKVSSIHTVNCVLIYEDAFCQGSFVHISPGSGEDKFLGLVNFDNKVSSFRAC